jgi:hypothetical protein
VLAAAERINASYLARVLRLTLLAPDLVETVLAGKDESLTVDALVGSTRWNRSSSGNSRPCCRSALRPFRSFRWASGGSETGRLGLGPFPLVPPLQPS